MINTIRVYFKKHHKLLFTESDLIYLSVDHVTAFSALFLCIDFLHRQLNIFFLDNQFGFGFFILLNLKNQLQPEVVITI